MKGHLDIRAEEYEHLLRNFIGPLQGAEEVLERRSPHDTYLTGALYPASMRKHRAADDLEDLEIVDGEGHINSAEEAASAAKDVPEEVVLFPSSAGISFRLRKNVASIKLNVTFGTYKDTQIDGKNAFQRRQHSFDHSVSLDKENSSIWLIPEWAELNLKVRLLSDSKLVTMTLLNRARKEKFIPDGKGNWLFKNIATLWQVRISAQEVTSNDIIPINPAPRITSSKEINANFLLYRKLMPLAAGHNCSSDWNRADGILKVHSEFIPIYLLRMMVPSQISGVDLNIRGFSSVESLKCLGIPALKTMHSRYLTWIDRLVEQSAALESPELKKISEDLLIEIRRAEGRIAKGIEIIEKDESVAWCVSFANEVMEAQFKNRNPSGSFTWHPFQMAFFLLNIEGIVNPLSEDRNIADLLWFPTGGGKTEAYLLISAFTIAWRRLAGKKTGTGAGTAILLRYTLRLLTQQQLQRAARMVCSAETLRTRYPALLGDQPISIGLWVGGDSFPNTLKDWEQKRSEGKVPTPFESCPACAATLRVQNYVPKRTRHSQMTVGKLEIICDQNDKCPFHGRALPIHLTDEDVYRFSPTIVVGTVDKFANLTWKEDTAKIFNKYSFRCLVHGTFFENEARCSCSSACAETPPELIIQDELHLISGPLGSMVGAFENAVRYICRKNGIEPKYITSTATIRGAERQLSDLYSKNAFQFPPSGFDAEDNFFSEAVAKDNLHKTRAYVGISAQGRSPKLVMARLYGLLNHVYQEFRKDADTDQTALDCFRTVVGYFNARRELGGVKTMLGDDVPKWRKFHHSLDLSDYDDSKPLDVTELMGSVDSKQLMKDLERIARGNHVAPEFVLATNILSVGIDIDRLSLMVVAGQPKTASEYIQASSRVGRSGPGIVVVSYNWARARDRSHYEKFRSFHEQLYRYVEGISVTPCSPEARRRTLAGTFVAVARHCIRELRGDDDAINFDAYHERMEDFKNYYLRSIVDPDERADAQREIEKFIYNWRRAAENKATTLSYKSGEKKRGVLGILGEQRDNCIDFFVTSLRNVDEEVPVQLTGRIYGA